MFDVPLIHRIFTRDETGVIWMEEAWDNRGQFEKVFGSDGFPHYRRWSYTQENYEGFKASFPRYVEKGQMTPEIAARTKWL